MTQTQMIERWIQSEKARVFQPIIRSLSNFVDSHSAKC
uniref:Uncharacterized protein n=1 Tax=Klebsiella pneumoniae TaxID=573 RepID=A0A8B0SUN0_KLEPN|nr:hypothetical protein [Klebsiella pneumoniae]